MKRNRWWKAGAFLLCAGVAFSYLARADFEVTGPDGRRILLRDDGTWRYMDAKDRERPAKDPAKETTGKETAKGKPVESGEAVLRVQRKRGDGNGCRFELQLVNNLPYEIRSLAPSFSAHRANGVVYESVLTAFQTIRPGDSQSREILFRGIACQDIARVQVVGGDRCVMGELDRWDATDGSCLKRVRVVESDLVRFDK